MDHNKTQSDPSTNIEGLESQREKVHLEEEKVPPLMASQLLGTPNKGMNERSVSRFDDGIPMSPEYHLSNHVGFGLSTEKGHGSFSNIFGGGVFDYDNEYESHERLLSTAIFNSDIYLPNFNQPTYPCS